MGMRRNATGCADASGAKHDAVAASQSAAVDSAAVDSAAVDSAERGLQ
jgi:hypothetical protein